MALEWNDKHCVEHYCAVAGPVAYHIIFDDKKCPPVTCYYEIKSECLEENVYGGPCMEAAKVWAENHYEKTFKGRI